VTALLAHTDLTVVRCAHRLGFPDQANFTTFFQRQTGTAPTPWRRAESDRHPVRYTGQLRIRSNSSH
jgi:AraC-like DNA-binding protein